jgi:hypothetical protein
MAADHVVFICQEGCVSEKYPTKEPVISTAINNQV